jgi:predicted DNA-binding protein
MATVNRITRSFSIPHETSDAINRLAAKEDRPKSQILARAIDHYDNKMEGGFKNKMGDFLKSKDQKKKKK